MKIGYDPNWYPFDFEKQTSYVNGYTENLLIEMASSTGRQFELITANWDTLFDGLGERKYDAVLSTMAPYAYHLAKYDFSENILTLGPVLIIPYKGEKRTLDELEGECIGIMTNDPATYLIEKHPSIILRSYDSAPNLLNALVKGDIQGAILNHLPAASYVRDLYRNILEIVGVPLTKDGLHFVTRKGDIKPLQEGVETLRKKKMISTLQKKWFSLP